MEPVKVLFVSSNPHWTERLDLGDEMRELLHSLRGQDIELMPLPAAQREDLEAAVTTNDIDVLHFSGHATASDGIILRDEDGMEVAMSGAELSQLIEDKNIKLSFLHTGNATAKPLLSEASPEEHGVKIKNQAHYDKYFFISYLDEQIRNLQGRVQLNRRIFRTMLVFGAAFLVGMWYFEFDKLALLVNFFGQERINTYVGKPYLDSLIAIGAAIPILLASFQNRLTIHSNQEIRSLTQMKELVKSAEDLSPEMQTRVRVVMDQCIRGADKEYQPKIDWYEVFDKNTQSSTNAPA